jgi:hypothetical protein
VLRLRAGGLGDRHGRHGGRDKVRALVAFTFAFALASLGLPCTRSTRCRRLGERWCGRQRAANRRRGRVDDEVINGHRLEDLLLQLFLRLLRLGWWLAQAETDEIHLRFPLGCHTRTEGHVDALADLIADTNERLPPCALGQQPPGRDGPLSGSAPRAKCRHVGVQTLACRPITVVESLLRDQTAHCSPVLKHHECREVLTIVLECVSLIPKR